MFEDHDDGDIDTSPAGPIDLASLNLYLSEPQRVSDHRYAGERHGGGGDHRGQQQAEYGIQDARGDGDALLSNPVDGF